MSGFESTKNAIWSKSSKAIAGFKAKAVGARKVPIGKRGSKPVGKR